MLEKKVPMRRCIGCMKSFPKKQLVRIVAADEGVLLDPKGIAPGRGAYLCRSEKCAALALKKNAVGRSLKKSINAEEGQKLLQQITILQKAETTGGVANA